MGVEGANWNITLIFMDYTIVGGTSTYSSRYFDETSFLASGRGEACGEGRV
jgi:hypothetical protein